MSSLALYRRYRPETFAEVIGQEHVTDPLQQALRNNRVNHAYLFSGPRGCGKTTSARILARCLNCEQGPTPTPCGVCRSCVDLARGGAGSIDVIEIDAASHGGVDDARELREKAFFGPAASRYKIYIVDEAHMVTTQGFNALLKVVEEPPEHLKFIFATTEPEKVIGTVRSRTHHYPFRLVPPGTLRDYLAQVCAREDIAVEEAVLPLVVRAGAGSVRDSMSVMDQLLAGAGAGGVTYAMATALLGYTDSALLDEVVDAFAAGDGGAAFAVVDRVIEGGHDPRRFVTDLLERLRDLVILAAVPDALETGLIDAPAEVLERMRAQAEVFGAAELSRAADLVNAGLTEMRGATSPRLQLELICARVLLPAAYADERSVQARLDRLERGVGSVGGGAAFGGVSGGVAAAAPGGGLGPGVGGQGVAPGAQGAAPGGLGGPGGASGAGGSAGPGEVVAAGGAAGSGGLGGSGAEGVQPAAASPAGTPGEGGAGQGGRRPGAWPTASSGGAPGAAAAPAAPAPAAPAASAPAPAAPAPARPASAPAAPAASGPGGGGGDVAQVRQIWPDVLEAVKSKRRFTWILLSQNAQVSGFDGTTLQLAFPNVGARDSFVSGGSEDVLRAVLGERFGVQWKIDSVVDAGGGGGGSTGPVPPGRSVPSGPGSGPGFGGPAGSPQGSGFGGPGSSQQAPGAGFGGAGPSQPPPGAPSYAPHPAPAGPSAPQAHASESVPPGPSRPEQAPQPSAQQPQPSAPQQSPQARAPEPEAPAPPPVSVEDDIPEDDDPDLDESALSGQDLIVRELGATVIEEIEH
ncbi:DNA polymerase III subunit gamma and tau [Streptomyces sp. JJ66]|uniref:DNA polymerase III subunit gamma and tau n=1 Tax=Streptomyces sp. JJ66 TaxID=2803843 RepID=UPI001C5825FE|nr:DNA polymerase III subunit gamma and tau [Streptomyces sp. JJ66]MBW1602362.1 DNA polymerase III subunit gamma and tau [Streptomyces sp. JJ66]